MSGTEAKKREYACTCAVCGRAFTAGSPRAKYCSDGCRNKARREREKLRREAERAEKTEGAQGAGHDAGTGRPPLFPGVAPEPPREAFRAASRAPETEPPGTRAVPAARRQGTGERPAALRRPVPKERLVGFERAGGRQDRYVRSAAMDEFRRRVAAWGSILIFGCALAFGTLLAWPGIGTGQRVLCAALSAAPCLAGAAGMMRNRACLERVREGRFKVLKCEVTKYFAFTKPEARAVLIRTEKGQRCGDAFHVDMGGYGGDDVILVRCIARGKAAFVLIRPEP